MAVWVLRVAASLYILLHTGQGRGSWNASFRPPVSLFSVPATQHYFQTFVDGFFFVSYSTDDLVLLLTHGCLCDLL